MNRDCTIGCTIFWGGQTEMTANPLKSLVGAGGFELPTPWSQTRRGPPNPLYFLEIGLPTVSASPCFRGGFDKLIRHQN
jgi:hypothetical protein